VLEAYDKVELIIAGNGTHPAPWHAKLGFQPRLAIATLHTLSPDGGVVPCLQLVVTKERICSYLRVGPILTLCRCIPLPSLSFARTAMETLRGRVLGERKRNRLRKMRGR
jgi:hypothetical protein